MADNLRIEPDESGMLDVGDGHSMYWETVGPPSGIPAVFLHGGPGSGASEGARRYFDPEAYRAVLFDQRGCGRSRPLVADDGYDLSLNTTDHLVEDIEHLRRHLGIDRWVVVGVSWGCTLGLIYAQRHPDRVRGLVLGPVTAGTRRETEWITRDMGRIFPKEWEDFVSAVPKGERDGDLAAAFSRLLSSPDPAVREDAARRWCAWEDTHVSLMPGWQHREQYDDPTFRMVFATLVTHFWSNACFLAHGEIFKGMERLDGVPGVLLHGRHDVSGPLETAWRLHKLWPTSSLIIVDDAGHGGGSFGREFTAAIGRLRHLVNG